MQLKDDFSVQKTKGGGSIEVICGSMFSGKTEELINRLNNVRTEGFSVEIFTPAMDTRYSRNAIVSHNDNSIPAISVSTSADILAQGELSEVVGIDEAQFFDSELPEICNLLANRGVRVIVAGLDMDFKGRPFGPIPGLMAIAESVTKLHAKCVVCGQPAMYSYRIVPGEGQVLLGETESYEARCRVHFGS
jgi:thymidine kinase